MKKTLFVLTTVLACTEQLLAVTTQGDHISFKQYAGSSIGKTHTLAGEAFGSKDPYFYNSDDPSTVQDGEGYFAFGGLNEITTLTLTNNLEGYVAFTYKLKDKKEKDTTNTLFTVDATAGGLIDGDDSTISSVQGSMSLAAKKQKKNPTYALVVNNQDGKSKSLGNLTLIEGNYFGSEGTGAALINNVTKVNINGTAFVAGDSTDFKLGYFGPSESALAADNRGVYFIPNSAVLVDSVSSTPFEAAVLTANPPTPEVNFLMNMTINNESIERTRDQILSEFDGLKIRDAFIGGNNAASASAGSVVNAIISGSAGHGLHITPVKTGGDDDIVGATNHLSITGGDFFGGDSSARISIGNGALGPSDNAMAIAEGGSGMMKMMTGNLSIDNARFVGGRSGTATVFADNSSARASGGRGIMITTPFANSTIQNSRFEGGRAGSATILNSSNSYAIAEGGTGVQVAGSAGDLTVSNLYSVGGRAGNANASGTDTMAKATGGHGIHAEGSTVLIKDGTYIGGKGGTAKGDVALAYGGSGAYVNGGGTLTVFGGTFNGGQTGIARGEYAMDGDGFGIWADNATLNIAPEDDHWRPITINDGILFSLDPGRAGELKVLDATVNEGIYMLLGDEALATLTVGSNTINNGYVLQFGGKTVVKMNDREGSFNALRNVYIDGEMAFDRRVKEEGRAIPPFAPEQAYVTTSNSIFTLANEQSLMTIETLTVTDNSAIDIGLGRLNVTNDLVINNGSGLMFTYNPTITTNETAPLFHGQATVGGQLSITDNDCHITVNGRAPTPEGSLQLAIATSIDVTPDINSISSADLGWLVKTDRFEASSTDIVLYYEYNSLTNGNLSDLGTDLLLSLDGMMTNNFVSSGTFFELNKLEREQGERMLRYSESQMPDAVDTTFTVQQQVSEQIAARGTEFRSMNGFASTKKRSPQGASGPDSTEQDDLMQGWIRIYGAFSEQDAEGELPDYESDVVGTVVGIDRRFGNLLLGIAGGFASGTIDAGDTYDGEIDTYHGSLYSSIGSDKSYMDLALTIGISDTEVGNVATDDKFNSYSWAGYIGAGRSMELSENIKFTPEASFLLSYYDQEEYEREGINAKTLYEYDEWSYLSSIGANVALANELSFMYNIAFIPELRVHWLHEFNTDLDKFSYTSQANGRQSFAVRSREEDLLKVGVGLDIWSWKKQNTKFEVDYDGVYGDGYSQHTASGKVTIQF